MEFTIDRAITRIQEVHDFDCQLVKQVIAFHGTTPHTQSGPQDIVSSVVLPHSFLTLIQNSKNLLTPIVENFLSERRAGSYDMLL